MFPRKTDQDRRYEVKALPRRLFDVLADHPHDNDQAGGFVWYARLDIPGTLSTVGKQNGNRPESATDLLLYQIKKTGISET